MCSLLAIVFQPINNPLGFKILMFVTFAFAEHYQTSDLQSKNGCIFLRFDSKKIKGLNLNIDGANHIYWSNNGMIFKKQIAHSLSLSLSGDLVSRINMRSFCPPGSLATSHISRSASH